MSLKLQLGHRSIGPDYPPLVIAEIGINHEGNFDKAIQMVDDALCGRMRVCEISVPRH